MKQKIPILILLATAIITAKSIEPKVIRANDGYRSTRTTNSTHTTKDDMILSTIEASSQVSIQITSAMSLEATTQETSYENPPPRRQRRRYSQLKFLKKNKEHITQNISQGDGEYLTTLLNLMSIKPTSKNLSKIQSNFETLSKLKDKEFLAKIEEITS